MSLYECSITGLKWCNTTPHAITVLATDGSRITVPPCGTVIRVRVRTLAETDVRGIRMARIARDDLEAPPPEWLAEADIVLVSEIAAKPLARALGRTVYVPDTGPGSVIRNAEGQVEAVKRLIAIEGDET